MRPSELPSEFSDPSADKSRDVLMRKSVVVIWGSIQGDLVPCLIHDTTFAILKAPAHCLSISGRIVSHE
jgi:hypothetical protein